MLINVVKKGGNPTLMKILFVDILSPIGHKNYNYKIIELLSSYCEIDTAFKENYLSDFSEASEYINNMYDIPNEYFPNELTRKNKKLYKLIYRINLFKAMNWINKLSEKNNYDLILFGGVEIVSFCLSTLRLKGRYVFIDHGVAYIVTNKVKRFFWKHLNKNIEAIAMEDYIQNYLISHVNIKNKVWLLKHPLPNIDMEKIKAIQVSKKLIFAPSGSNDEEFISYLIYNNIMLKDYKVIIKSKKQNFENENLVVFNKRITDEDYYGIMAACDFVLLPYDLNYNNRVSGVFFEAVALNKSCLVNTHNTLKYYAEKYAEVVNGYDGYNNFFEVLEGISTRKSDTEEVLKKIKNDYSSFELRKQLKLIIYNEDRNNG